MTRFLHLDLARMGLFSKIRAREAEKFASLIGKMPLIMMRKGGFRGPFDYPDFHTEIVFNITDLEMYSITAYIPTNVIDGWD